MRVSRAIVDQLAEGGIDTVFGIPGKQTLPLNEAIEAREDVRFVSTRHETAVSHAAWGYAETSGRPAATLVVPGPGDMNAMNGLKNARNDCTPLVHIAVETDPTVRGGDGIHETPPDTYDNVVKENTLVERPSAVRVEVAQAIETAMTPPKGPVRVGVPKNVLPEEYAIATPQPLSPASPPAPAEGDIEAAAACLASADRPAVLVGGGVRSAQAGSELVSVADVLDAPVITTYKGKGIVPDENDRVAGTLSGSASPELLDCLADSDALLAVGTDFDAVATRRWSVEMPDDIVQITLSPGDLGTGYDLTVGIVADAKHALDALESALDETAGDGGGRKRATVVRDAFDQRIDSLLDDQPPLSSVGALRAVREAVPEGTVVSVDAGGFRVWGLNAFAASGPRAYVNPGSWATMGTGLPAALGAQLANPDRDVLALTGDGGLMMCIHELHTAASEGIPVTVVVFRNDDYAIISEEAERAFEISDGAYDWSGAPLDFVAIAAGMGVEASRAETPAAIEAELADALDSDDTRLVEIPTDPEEPQASEWLSRSDQSGDAN
ncbi:thiamine pyrophosphate-binding protein [Halovenus sp. HT40]|uniref:thiamine pyrophosphate-binding protein n=1 Tax=Halovenus sp. HT40 TaxID=3126691 RepID=UPI00300F4385